jgi:hypothetical protein
MTFGQLRWWLGFSFLLSGIGVLIGTLLTTSVVPQAVQDNLNLPMGLIYSIITLHYGMKLTTGPLM